MNENMTLPDKPSALIHLALIDLELVEKNSKYKVEMFVYGDYYQNAEKYPVSLSGAVMVQRGDTGFTRYYPGDFTDKNTANKLFALDSLRLGKVKAFMSQFPSELVNFIDAFPARQRHRIYKHHIPLYYSSEKRFKSSLKRLAVKLEKLGI